MMFANAFWHMLLITDYIYPMKFIKQQEEKLSSGPTKEKSERPRFGPSPLDQTSTVVSLTFRFFSK